MNIRIFAGKTNSIRSETGGLLKTGVFSFLLHIILISFLIVNLKTGTTKGKFPVYRVTIQPLSIQTNLKPLLPQASPTPQPVPEKPQIQKEEMKPKEEAKKSESVKELKQLTQLMEDEETIRKPIPLPMAEISTLNTDSKLQEEQILPIPPALSSEEKTTSAKLGTGTGTGGSSLTSSGEGEGIGGGSRWGGIGKGTGPERGGSGFGGSGKGTGAGRGSGIGTGRGGGWGGPGAASPKYSENPKPPYPLEARNKGYQGRVLLKVEVLPDGRVGEIELKESSGYEVLDQSALATVKKWRFIPARKGKVTISCWVNIPITFQLKDISF
jgi:TonB family protein